MASGETLFERHVLDNQLIDDGTISPASIAYRNGVAVGVMRNGPAEDDGVEFGIVMPQNFAGTTGITIKSGIIGAAGPQAATTIHLICALERVGVNVQTVDSLAYTVTQTENHTHNPTTSGAGGVTEATFAFLTAAMDGIVAGDYFRLRLSRDPDNAGDDYGGAAEFVYLRCQET